MNDFASLAGAQRVEKDVTGLVELSVHLARRSCGPVYGSHVSPDREVIAYVAKRVW
jgi:hypothetical protein